MDNSDENFSFTQLMSEKDNEVEGIFDNIEDSESISNIIDDFDSQSNFLDREYVSNGRVMMEFSTENTTATTNSLGVGDTNNPEQVNMTEMEVDEESTCMKEKDTNVTDASATLFDNNTDWNIAPTATATTNSLGVYDTNNLEEVNITEMEVDGNENFVSKHLETMNNMYLEFDICPFEIESDLHKQDDLNTLSRWYKEKFRVQLGKHLFEKRIDSTKKDSTSLKEEGNIMMYIRELKTKIQALSVQLQDPFFPKRMIEEDVKTAKKLYMFLVQFVDFFSFELFDDDQKKEMAIIFNQTQDEHNNKNDDIFDVENMIGMSRVSKLDEKIRHLLGMRYGEIFHDSEKYFNDINSVIYTSEDSSIVSLLFQFYKEVKEAYIKDNSDDPKQSLSLQLPSMSNSINVVHKFLVPETCNQEATNIINRFFLLDCVSKKELDDPNSDYANYLYTFIISMYEYLFRLYVLKLQYSNEDDDSYNTIPEELVEKRFIRMVFPVKKHLEHMIIFKKNVLEDVKRDILKTLSNISLTNEDESLLSPVVLRKMIHVCLSHGLFWKPTISDIDYFHVLASIPYLEKVLYVAQIPMFRLAQITSMSGVILSQGKNERV